MKWQLLTICLLVMLMQGYTAAQECLPPIVNSFVQQGSDAVEVKWLDSNPAGETESYLIRYRQVSESVETTLEGITTRSTLLSDLMTGQDYELYIRAECITETSEWNGPYRFSTGIDNSQPCGLNLAIKDNGCPSRSTFPITVDGVTEGQLLESVDLTIEHPWPADLSISLISPSGIETPLVRHKGTFTQDLGTPSSDDCRNPTSFSDLACSTLENGIADLSQSFRPLSPLSAVSTENNGTWLLSICDRASGDIGILRGAHLSYIESPCQVPTLTQISNITHTSVKVDWDQPSLCNRIVLNIGKRGFPILNGSLTYVECIEDEFTLLDLEPDTEYDLYIATECQEGVLSPFSCRFPLKTTCAAPIATESFDTQDTCAVLCQTECRLSSNLWTNSGEDGAEWIPRSGKTPTEFTGPDSDIHTLGSYIYLENQPDICNSDVEAILESSCVYVREDTATSIDDCDLEFAYHLYGQDVASLRLSVITADQTETTLWTVAGDQSNLWNTTGISLSDYSGQVVTLRFIAMTSTTVFGDIGLDQITYIGLDPFDESLVYYRDSDGDGYGSDTDTAYGCDLEPLGFTQVGGDCDDSDADIHPTATEIPCNGIDENCNGNTDDLTLSTLDYQITDLQPSICGGQTTGSITVDPIDGNEPYQIIWSTGSTGETLTQIPAGTYTATLTDDLGCTTVTGPIIVPNIEEVSYSISQLIQPECSEIPDGQISLLTNCESDCTITWSTGQTGNTLSNVGAGDYFAVINSEGCLTVTDTIALDYSTAPLAGIQLIRPVTCHGGVDGRIIASSITGSSLAYLWSTGHQGPTLSDLSAGNYSLTVTDPSSGCSEVIADIEVTQPEPIAYVFDEVGNNLCPGDQNAAIQISVTGGTQPYSYNWNTNAFTDDIFHLGSGNYRASITDSKGCGIITETVIIQEPQEIVIEVGTIHNTTCIGSNDGSVSIHASGGTGQLSYLWNTPDNNSSTTIDNLQSGLYSVTVVDEIGCKTTVRNIPVMSDGIILESELNISDAIACAGDSTGLLAVTLTDGVAPFNYNWSNGIIHETDDLVDELGAIESGTYTVTITDAIGCTSESNSVTLSDPQPLTWNVGGIDNLSCSESNDGAITINISGGTQPIDILWSTGDSVTTLSALHPGLYTVTLTDDNGCTTESTPIEVTAPDPLLMNHQIAAQMGSILGTYLAAPSGGVTPYTVAIDGIVIPLSEMPYSLSAGTYEVLLTDDNDCTLSETIEIDLISSSTESTLSDQSVILYPNPSSSRINTISDTTIRSLSLYTLDGQLVLSAHQDWLDVSGLSDGVYLCKVVTAEGIFLRRVSIF